MNEMSGEAIGYKTSSMLRVISNSCRWGGDRGSNNGCPNPNVAGASPAKSPARVREMDEHM